MLLYYITDRRLFSGDETARQSALLARVAEAARCGIDWIQLREKDLPAGKLERLAREAVRVVRSESATTKLLVNSRIDIALGAGADGVHLTSNDILPADARGVVMDYLHRSKLETGTSKLFLIGVSCHSKSEVRLADSHGADFAVLAPIFEKVQANQRGIGLAALREAAFGAGKPDNRVEAGDRSGSFPVLALGGVTVANAAACRAAGAAGIAGIRLFQQGSLSETVAALKRL